MSRSLLTFSRIPLVLFLGGSGLLAACASPAPSERAGPAAARVLVEPEAGPMGVLELVAAARVSVWAEMYLLTDGQALAALVERRRAGCDVRVLLEPHPYQADGANDPAFDQLEAAGVVVRWANPRFALTHAKVLAIDHVRLAVLTLNLTRAGLAGNREYAVIDDDQADVATTEAVLAADLTGGPDPPEPPGTRVVTSPAATRPAVAALIAGARRTLAVEMEELSDPALVGALLDAAGRGVEVGVGLPEAATQSAATRSAAARLAAGGATVRSVASPPLHAKAIVADASRLYVGSANLTAAALGANREVGLILDAGARDHASAPIAEIVSATIATDLAGGETTSDQP